MSSFTSKNSKGECSDPPLVPSMCKINSEGEKNIKIELAKEKMNKDSRLQNVRFE